MRLVRLDNLRGDEILARPLYSQDGQILLREGVILKKKYIERLFDLGVLSVYIDDEVSRGIEINDVVSNETRQESKRAIKKMFDKYLVSGSSSVDGIAAVTDNIIEEILSQKDVLINLTDIRTKEDTLFSHSVNVGILATITGINLGYNMIKLKDLAIGGMMHDIGKIEIIKEQKMKGKDAKISQEMYREHTKIGYDLLSKQPTISSYVKLMALTHHEKCDGSGFPLGLKGSEIHEMAKIIAVCNAFDNMVFGNEVNERIPSYLAVEYLMASVDIFDIEIVRKFISSISLYPTGSIVMLNTGERCIVVQQNKGFPARPIVKVIEDKNGKVDIYSNFIDLAISLTVFVDKVLE